jgi:hypothetical protein
MRKRMSREDFLTFFDAIWERGPLVRYLSPDSWCCYSAPANRLHRLSARRLDAFNSDIDKKRKRRSII